MVPARIVAPTPWFVYESLLTFASASLNRVDDSLEVFKASIPSNCSWAGERERFSTGSDWQKKPLISYKGRFYASRQTTETLSVFMARHQAEP